MKVLVTGGNGFIGRYVCHELESQGHEPVIFDVTGPPSIFSHRKHYLGDVRDATAVTEAVAHVDGVIHLAAVLGSQETVANPRPAVETNLLGSINVFEACVQYDTPVAYAAVGNAWLRSMGAGGYTITKEAVTDFASMYKWHRGLRVNVVRPMNAYGPFQSVSRHLGGSSSVRKIMPTFICSALSGRPIEIYGDGEQISDVVWVGDVAKVLVSAVWDASKNRLHPTVEVGPKEHLSVNQVAYAIAEEVFDQTDLGWPTVEYLPMRPGERKGETIADQHSLVPYNICLAPLLDCLPTTVAWYAKHVNWR